MAMAVNYGLQSPQIRKDIEFGSKRIIIVATHGTETQDLNKGLRKVRHC